MIEKIIELQRTSTKLFCYKNSFKCPPTKNKFDERAKWVEDNCEGEWSIDKGSYGYWPCIRLCSEKDYVAYLLKWS